MEAPGAEVAVLVRSPLVRHWLWHEEIDSTQRLARELAGRHGAGLLVLADGQTAGRGREGRAWFSPRGAGLWLSLATASARPVAEWPMLTSLAALAVVDALAGAGLEAGVKWPNDVCCGGRKIAGLLADVVAVEPAAGEAAGDRRAIVLGVGLNLAQRGEEFPPELRDVATSFAIAAGRPIARAEMLEALLGALERRLQRFEEVGAAALRVEVRAAALLLGRRVRIAAAGGVLEGVARDVGEIGELVVESSVGTRTAVTGGSVLSIDPPLDRGRT